MYIGSSLVTSKGQVTIPKEIRDSLRLREGDSVRFSVERDKIVISTNEEYVKSVSGSLRKYALNHLPSDEELDTAVGSMLTEQYQEKWGI